MSTNYNEATEENKPVFCDQCHLFMAQYLMRQKNSETDSQRIMKNKLSESIILREIYNSQKNPQDYNKQYAGIIGFARKSAFDLIESDIGKDFKFNRYSISSGIDGLISKQLIYEISVGTAKFYRLTPDGLAVYKKLYEKK